jgi:hypothetical protein
VLKVLALEQQSRAEACVEFVRTHDRGAEREPGDAFSRRPDVSDGGNLAQPLQDRQTPKLSPQLQVLVALGFLILKPRFKMVDS